MRSGGLRTACCNSYRGHLGAGLPPPCPDLVPVLSSHVGTCTAQIFGGSFGGPTLYDNPDYTSPNAVRAAIKRQAAGKYGSKVAARDRREAHKGDNPLPRDPMEGLFRGEDDEGDEGSE